METSQGVISEVESMPLFSLPRENVFRRGSLARLGIRPPLRMGFPDKASGMAKPMKWVGYGKTERARWVHGASPMARMHPFVAQAAAIPLRAGRVCLVTSRGGKGLVVPKGRLESGRTAEQMALQEAWEEAGLIGILHAQPIGSYRYEKAGSCFEVVLFLMDVTTVVKKWPERRYRSRHWLLPAEAATRVRERGLCQLLREVPEANPACGALPARPRWG